MQLRIAPAMRVYNNCIRETMNKSMETVTVGQVRNFVEDKMPFTYEQLRNRRKYILKKQKGKDKVCDISCDTTTFDYVISLIYM